MNTYFNIAALLILSNAALANNTTSFPTPIVHENSITTENNITTEKNNSENTDHTELQQELAYNCPNQEPKLIPTSKEEKLSYSIGYKLGIALKESALNKDDMFDPSMLNQGLVAAFSADEPILQGKEIDNILNNFVTSFNETKIKQKKNHYQAGIKFLQENSQKPGVITTPSGLQYQILNQGRGDKPTLQDSVAVAYQAFVLENDKLKPINKTIQNLHLKLEDAILGWQEALQLMQPKSKLRIFLPSNLAYGTEGIANVIPKGSVVVFELTLLQVTI